MGLRSLLGIIFRVLRFRASREDLAKGGLPLVAVGMAITWLVGIGRWWDDPRTLEWYVRWGFGSLLYVGCLSLVLFALAAPLSRRASPDDFRVTLSFVTASALPGIVYAIPIELIAGPSAASAYNVAALIFVSLYRLALLYWFFYSVLGLPDQAWILTSLPVAAIVAVVSMMNMGPMVVDIMGGFRETMPKSEAESIVEALGCISFIVTPILIILYLGQVYVADRGKK